MAQNDLSFNPGFITATATLLQSIDSYMIILLNDGKSYLGTLRSVDSYGTCVLEEAVERIYVGNKYGDIPCGVIILRGENIAIIGEIDDTNKPENHIIKVSLEEIVELQRQEALKLISEQTKLKNYGLDVDKTAFNWYMPFSFIKND